jgi:CheY-like chemotaxis protein
MALNLTVRIYANLYRCSALSTHSVNGSEIFNTPKPGTSDHTGLSGTVVEIKDAGAALWKEAYDHRGEIAVVAGTVAASALALYAGREQLARLLPAAGKDVLLVEDTPFMGKAMKSALEHNGEHVTWITGVKRAAPLTGTTIDGTDLVLDPRKFKVALVDGQLDGSYLQGEHIVHALHQDGLTSIGTSTANEVNSVMRANGAELAAPKTTIVAALVNDQLDLARAVSSPGAVQQGLDSLTTRLKGPEGRALRQKGDELLTKFMKEAPNG